MFKKLYQSLKEKSSKLITFVLENSYSLLFNYPRFQSILILVIAAGLVAIFSVVLWTTILSQINFQTVILIKLVASLIYLTVNYITHKFQLPISLANVLRLFISCLDFVILLMLMFHYVWEWCVMAYGYSIIGVLFSIFLCVLNWATLVRQDEQVQPVFIIGIFCLIVLLVLYCQFISMGLGYKGIVSALFMFNGIYISCWLIFDPYAKAITGFMEHIGDNLSWIDPLIGDMSHKEVALRNLCSFNLGLLNLTYIHVSGGDKFCNFN